MKKVSQHRKMSVDSGVGEKSSTSSNASIVSSGIVTPKGDCNSLVNLNSNSSAHSKTTAAGLDKGINDIRITENPISESPEAELAAGTVTAITNENPVC